VDDCVHAFKRFFIQIARQRVPSDFAGGGVFFANQSNDLVFIFDQCGD
jgi:hypothetical protein